METITISIEKVHQDPRTSLKYILNEVEENNIFACEMKTFCAHLYSIERIYNNPIMHNNTYTWNIQVPNKITLEFKNHIRNSLIIKYKLKLIGYFDVF